VSDLTKDPDAGRAARNSVEPMRGRRRTFLVLLAIAVVLLVGAGLVLTLRDNARPVGLDEARDRTTTTAPTGSTTAPGDTRPALGVYEYRGTGTEALSTPPLSQSQGPTMPATVEWQDEGCWSFRIDYSSNHWQSWTYCPRDDLVVETGGSTWQRWMIGTAAITNLSTFECAPGSVATAAGATEGQEWAATCTGSGDAVAGETISSGTERYVGEELVDVGGEQVRTQHFVSERTMSGAQTGTDRSDVWFHADTGLPVRNERRIEATSDTPIGTSTYTEVGEFELVSTGPT
jgi:hypothetical protein